jgi:hypothetical protein
MIAPTKRVSFVQADGVGKPQSTTAATPAGKEPGVPCVSPSPPPTSEISTDESLCSAAAPTSADPQLPPLQAPTTSCAERADNGHFGKFLSLVFLFSVILGCFHVHLVLAAAATITVTFDETAHVGAGVTFWKYNDFRLNPENGVLPQLIAGGGIILGRPGVNYTIPAYDQPAWRYSDCWSIGFQLLHESGNTLRDILHDGRRGIAVRRVVAFASLSS